MTLDFYIHRSPCLHDLCSCRRRLRARRRGSTSELRCKRPHDQQSHECDTGDTCVEPQSRFPSPHALRMPQHAQASISRSVSTFDACSAALHVQRSAQSMTTIIWSRMFSFAPSSPPRTALTKKEATKCPRPSLNSPTCLAAPPAQTPKRMIGTVWWSNTHRCTGEVRIRSRQDRH
jgi:hypothetical protein